MFCSFDEVPNILRLYGKGKTILRKDKEWKDLSEQFEIYPSTRQIITADITKVQTSCGFGVPMFKYMGDRKIHFQWAEKKGVRGLTDYVAEKNLYSMDGLPTRIHLDSGDQH